MDGDVSLVDLIPDGDERLLEGLPIGLPPDDATDHSSPASRSPSLAIADHWRCRDPEDPSAASYVPVGAARRLASYRDPTPMTGISKSTSRIPVDGSQAVAINVPLWTQPAKNAVGEKRTTA
jgi:hypothetical protein